MADPLPLALAQLDPANDAHWTDDGLPRIDAVAAITGNQFVKRKDITDAAPGYTRDSALEELTAPDNPPATTPTTPEVAEVTEPEAEAPESANGPDDEIMLMPFQRVMSDPNLVDRVLVELERQERELLKERAELNARIEQVQAKSDVAKRQASRFRKADPNRLQRQIRDYQNTQKRVREERAANRIKLFGDEATAKRIQAATQVSPSPIDVGLAARNRKARREAAAQGV